MRFALSTEQRAFAASLHELLSDADTPTVIRRWGAGEHEPGLALWQRLAELGVTGLAVPERWEGLGADPVDLVVAFEELGRHAVPGPVVESIAAVPTLLAELGAEALCEKWLPALAAGRSLATLSFPPDLPYALDADVTELVLLIEGDRLYTAEIDPAVPLSSVDAARRLSPVLPVADLGQGEPVLTAAQHAFDRGALACAAQLLGAGRALLDASTEYAGQRVQFGRPIGQFQAVKHQLADVLVGLELARPLVHGAAVAVAAGADTASRDVSAAKVACSDAAYRAARTALQVHGAVGYTVEHDLGLWLTKVRALVSAWGTTSAHRSRVMAALLAETAGREVPCGSR